MGSPAGAPASATKVLRRGLIWISEQRFEIGSRQRLGERAVGLDDARGKRHLAFGERANLFLNRSAGQQAISGHRAMLSDPMRSVDRLTLDGGVPPRIVQDHIIRGGERQAD